MKSLLPLLFLISTPGASANESTVDTKINVANVCESHEAFKKLNKVLCAAAFDVRETPQAIKIEKALACLYPTVREDAQICPPAELDQMDLPEVPFLEGELPLWPADMEPVLLKVNGKSLNAVLPLHSSFFNDEFSLESSCASKDGDLRKTDRILCAPFVENHPLADAGIYKGDPRDLIIQRLKKQIQELEAEIALPPPAATPKIETPDAKAQKPLPETATRTVEISEPKTKDDLEPSPAKEKPKPLKVYGNK